MNRTVVAGTLAALVALSGCTAPQMDNAKAQASAAASQAGTSASAAAPAASAAASQAGQAASAAASQAASAAPTVAAQASSAASSAAGNGAAILASLGLTGLDGKQVVEKLDQLPTGRPLPMKASVRPDQVIIGNDQGETSLPLTGENSFYLSIAPYVSTTHDCHFHSLATCQGEMVNKPVHVTIKDAAGKVLVDKDVTTYSNGFVGFWLPKDIKGTVTVSADGKQGTVPFATGPQDATCLTTLKLG